MAPWAAYAAKGAASLAASYIDLAGNGHDAGVGVAPTWSAADGWIFNGSTQYLTTTFMPQNDQSQTVLMQFTALTNNGNTGMGSGIDRYFMLYPNDGTDHCRLYNGQYSFTIPAVTSGNLAIAGNQGYRNGASFGVTIGAWGGAAAHTFYIGARNNIGVVSNYMAVKIQALILFDVTLTASQVAAVAAAMASI